MTLNVERRNRNEALVSERGETWQKPTAKLATIINLPAVPKKTRWRLRMHSSLSTAFTPLNWWTHIIYLRRNLSQKFTNGNGLPGLRKTTNLLLRKPNVLIIVTGVPEWSLTSDLISNSYGQNKNEEVKNGNLLHQQLFSRVVSFQWISLWVPVLSLSVREQSLAPSYFGAFASQRVH